MEIWKNIIGYENYQVSNYGRVKSLRFGKQKILKDGNSGKGYRMVVITNKEKRKCIKIHKLVAQSFLNHILDGKQEYVINHIDFNRTNNHVDNLEIVTNRYNSSYSKRNVTSKYTGVCWVSLKKKWKAQIMINKKQNHLGYFINEYDAHLAYENKLKLISLENGKKENESTNSERQDNQGES